MKPPLTSKTVAGWGCAAPCLRARPSSLKGRYAIGSADGPTGRP